MDEKDPNPFQIKSPSVFGLKPKNGKYNKIISVIKAEIPIPIATQRDEKSCLASLLKI